MRRILILTLALAFTLSPFAQTKKPQQKAKTTVKRTAPVQKKTTTTAKKAVPVKKTATTQKKAVTTKKATTTKKAGTTQKKPVYTNTEIKGLQSQRAQIQKKIKEQEKLLQANRADVKDRLNNLYVINSEIEQHQKSIE